MNREEEKLATLRRMLLELWAMLVLAGIVGFMGPFGTYTHAGIAARMGNWTALLMGAYVLVRPAIFLLGALAKATGLPRGALVFWGVWLCSAPLAVALRFIGQDQFRELNGFTGILPFSILCSILILAVTRWAASADLRLAGRSDVRVDDSSPDLGGETGADEAEEDGTPDQEPLQPPLASRLSARFEGPILALQSEDHYVRVHGARDSELLLMRLRDAIAEMKGVPGEQVHRSWWVAQGGVLGISASGRTWVVHLTSGQTAPVARDSITRLQRAGFLPAEAE